MASAGPTRAGTLKGRKDLPRAPAFEQEPSSSQVAKEVNRIEKRLSVAQDKSEDISSWIRDPSQAVADPNLPLTPPSLPQDPEDRDGAADESSAVAAETLDEGTVSAETQRVQTPIIQQSPPTPDQTPPKHILPTQSLRKPKTPSIREPSSGAESFRTAQEQIESNDDLLRRAMDSRNSSEVRIGLGLGLETSDGSGTPTVRSPGLAQKRTSRDDLWDEQTDMVSEDPLHAPESVAVQRIQGSKAATRTPRDNTPERETSSSRKGQHASNGHEPRTVERPRREEKDSRTSSVEKFAEQIQWPSESDDIGTIRVDKKRLSELSTQSQVVQAYIHSTPPRRRQKLRHSSKNESLRAASSPMNSSNRSSLTSNDVRSRSQHLKTHPTDKTPRISANSDSGISMGSDMRKKVEEVLPLSEIPPRQSSLRRKKLENLRSFVEAARSNESATRPGTAPDTKSKPSFDAPLKRPRASSDAKRPAGLNEARGRKQNDQLLPVVPLVPPRSSSLSAPTSRNGSRTTSLTSTSLHKHNIQQQNLQQHALQHAPPQVTSKAATTSRPERPKNAERLPSAYLSVDSEGKRASDELSGGHHSLLTAPFSITSMRSSTPGPYEVNEATAIEIYPHNNTSVLVVQQLPPRRGGQPRLSASLSGNVRINLDSFGSPPRALNHHRLAESSTVTRGEDLRPPPVVLIPPTPAASTASPPVRGRRPQVNPSTSSRPLQTLRRALSARRYSENIPNPLTRTLVSRNNSYKAQSSEARRMVGNEGKSGQLSAFWRPRGFWNDLSDDEDDAQKPGFIRTSIRGPGDLGSTGIIRRLGSLRNRKKPVPTNQNDGTYVSYGRPEYPRYDSFGGDSYDEVERKVGIIARIRNTTHLRPFTSLQEAIREMKQKRVEDQLERQRARLKRNIGPVILEDNARPFY